MVIEMKMKEAPVLGAKGSKKESNVLKNAEWAKKAVPFLGPVSYTHLTLPTKLEV